MAESTDPATKAPEKKIKKTLKRTPEGSEKSYTKKGGVDPGAAA